MKQSVNINSYQYVVIHIIFFGGMSYFLYPDLSINCTSQAFWVPVVIWVLIAMLGAWLYSRTMAIHPGYDIVEIGILCFGKLGALIVLIPLFLFWFNSIVLMVRMHAELVTMTMLPTTPPWFLSAILVVPLFSASGGIRSIVRSAGIFVVVAVPLSLLMNVNALEHIDFKLGKPWLKPNGDFLFNTDFYASSYVWVGFIYIAVIGKFSSDPMKLWKPYVMAAFCFLPFILAGVLLPLLTFGPEFTRQLTFPYVTKMDSIDSYWILFEDYTAVFVSTTMIYVVSTISLMYFCLGQGIQSFFPNWNKKVVFPMLGILTYIAALAIPSWNWMVQALVWETPLRLYLSWGLPLFILSINAWKRRRNQYDPLRNGA